LLSLRDRFIRNRFEFFDSEATSIDMTLPNDGNPLIRPTVFTNKNFVLSGVTLFTDEFTIITDSSSMIESSDLQLSNRLIAVNENENDDDCKVVLNRSFCPL
jgi:hypothetical protein